MANCIFCTSPSPSSPAKNFRPFVNKTEVFITAEDPPDLKCFPATSDKPDFPSLSFGKDSMIQEELKAFLILKNILKLPQETLRRFLQQNSGQFEPTGWLNLCSSCANSVAQFFETLKEISRLERKLAGIETELKGKIQRSKEVASGSPVAEQIRTCVLYGYSIPDPILQCNNDDDDDYHDNDPHFQSDDDQIETHPEFQSDDNQIETHPEFQSDDDKIETHPEFQSDDDKIETHPEYQSDDDQIENHPEFQSDEMPLICIKEEFGHEQLTLTTTSWTPHESSSFFLDANDLEKTSDSAPLSQQLKRSRKSLKTFKNSKGQCVGYKCGDCPYVSTNIHRYKIHLKHHEPYSGAEICARCGWVVTNINRHLAKAHKDSKKVRKAKPGSQQSIKVFYVSSEFPTSE